jgi:hypothetical protein
MRHPLCNVPTALSVVLLAAVFFRATSAPIAPVDTWNHWKYGEWIWQHRKLPEREPFAGDIGDPNRRLVDPAWLAEVAGYLVYARAGMEGIALFYGLAEVLKMALLLAAYRRVSGSSWLALLGAVLVQAGSWGQFGVFRPEVLGEVCWAAVLCVTSPQRKEGNEPAGLEDSAHPTRHVWPLVILPVVFALWANLDASFVLGLLFLAVLLGGRFLQLQGGRDPGFHWLALAAAASAAAACVNPYGPSLIGTVLTNARGAFLQGAFEWQPLVPLATYSAQAFAASVLIVLATLRFSPRPFSAADGRLLAVFGLAAWFVGRLLPWWMMLWPFVLLPHWREIVASGQWLVAREDKRLPILATSRWPLAAAAAVAVALVLASGSGRWLLRGAPRPEAEQVAPGTPVEVAEQLDSVLQRRSARIFAPLPWCDYLLWRMPPAGSAFVYDQYDDAIPPKLLLAHAHILLMRRAPDDWRTLLDRHGIGVLALSADGRGKELFEHFLHGKEPGWQTVYVNAKATELIAERVR